MNPPINSTKAAALIEASTGRQCSRQNLEKLCANGGLQGSPCIVQAKPLRLNPDLLVSEYLAKVGPHQSEAVQPRMKRELPTRRDTTRPPRQLPQSSDDPPAQPDQGLPEYTISRARLEYEKANLAELERRAKAKLLLPREDAAEKFAFELPIDLLEAVLSLLSSSPGAPPSHVLAPTSMQKTHKTYTPTTIKLPLSSWLIAWSIALA